MSNQIPLVSSDTIEQAIKKFHIKKVKFALSEQQMNDILETALNNNYKHWVIIKTQLETGMRISEVCFLRIRAINFDESEIFLQGYKKDRYVKQWTPKTRAGNRIIPITKELGLELKKFIGKRERGYVFLSQKGGHYNRNSLINMINRYAKKTPSLGKNIGSHALRRTYASNLARKNIEIGRVSRILGHADIKTTMQYLYDIIDKKNFDDVRDAVKKMY